MRQRHKNLITKAMSGTVSLESLIGIKKKKKKGKRTMRSTSDILGDTGVSQDGMEAQGFDTAKTYAADGNTDGDTKPYKSPYEGQTVDL